MCYTFKARGSRRNDGRGAAHDFRKETQKMYRVLKRDGKTVDFDLSKISTAITLAFDACERQYNPSIIDFIALKVTAAFEPKVKNDLVSVEDIQDSVESVLAQAGYEDVAKAYILYRRQREKLRNMKSTMLDYKKLVDS